MAKSPNNTPDRHRPFETDLKYYQDRAAGLRSVWESGDPLAIALIRRHHPDYDGLSAEAVRAASFSSADAERVLAAEHGFESWSDFTRYINALSEGTVEEPFREAFVALRDGQRHRLSAVLDAHPGLVRAAGTNGNTLLNLAAYFKDIDALAMLIERGAEVNRPNNKGWTPLHQASVRSPSLDVIRFLLAAGADVRAEAYGSGGTPLAAALFHGYADAAELLAGRGVVPNNLRIVAGLGDVQRANAFFDDDGHLDPAAGRGREFYRIHSGYPTWTPGDDPQEIIDEAFTFACRNARIDAAQALLRRGARLNAVTYFRSALHWAIELGKFDTAMWLIGLGADPNVRDGRDGRGATPLHYACAAGNVALVRTLLDHGADAHVRDDTHQATATGWAEHCGHPDVVTVLNERG